MKCNLTKGSKITSQLKPSEQERLQKLMEMTLTTQLDIEETELQKLWIKSCCVLLHDTFNFDETQLMIFLGNWESIYRELRNSESSLAQRQMVDEQVSKVFPNGFPEQFLNNLANKGK